jgi:hypothetical protein
MYLDSHIRDFLRDEIFVQDDNKHKYAALYASSFFRVINYTLRNFDELKEHKYTCKFYLKFIKYFYKHGIYQKDLLLLSKKLYRGYNNNWVLTETFTDNGFISTSFSKEITTKFASNGTIITFDVSDLPTNVPFILINHKVADYLDEEEVVFLPGKININKSGLKARWKPKLNLIEKCKAKEMQGGRVDKIKVPKHDLRGRIVVFWRCIEGRYPEILGQFRLQNTHDGVYLDFEKVVYPRWDHLNGVKNFIPEYIDLDKIKNKSDVEKSKWWSYTVYMAIFNPKTKQVETLTYGIPEGMFSDITNVKEISKSIQKHKMLQFC